MNPVFQTKFGRPGGNCFAACLASVLELPSADDVPDFCNIVPAGEDWSAAASDWCRERFGLGLLTLRAPDGPEYKDERRYLAEHFKRSNAFVICGVKTERGGLHAVVFKDGKAVHDPFPEGSAIVGEIVDFTILYPLDPAAMRRPFTCKARAAGSAGGNTPQDCDWPACGCDPHADKVIAAIEESGMVIVPAPAAG